MELMCTAVDESQMPVYADQVRSAKMTCINAIEFEEGTLITTFLEEPLLKYQMLLLSTKQTPEAAEGALSLLLCPLLTDDDLWPSCCSEACALKQRMKAQTRIHISSECVAMFACTAASELHLHCLHVLPK